MQGATIVFDLDGTLVDSAPDLTAAVNHALSGLDLAPVKIDAVRHKIGAGGKAMLAQALILRGQSLSEAAVRELYDGRMLPYYTAHVAVLSRPYPGALPALMALKASGARLAVCTNKWEALARDLLQALDLLSLFDGLAGRDTFGVHKPDPGHLLGAIRLAGGDPAHAIMVGDTSIDVQAARQAHVPVIVASFGYLDTTVAELRPDAVISHYDELASVVSGLLG